MAFRPSTNHSQQQSLLTTEQHREALRREEEQRQAQRRETRIQRLRQLRRDFFRSPLYSPNRYTVQQIIGEGASGVVCKALDVATGLTVAVKRVSRGFANVRVSVRLLRELKFLRLLRAHANVVELQGLLLPSSVRDFDDVFLVFELMPTDLEHLLKSKSKLSPDHILWFMFQLLNGIHFLHSAGVFHRDLKPNNILINETCDLRICDFGLARAAFDNNPEMLYWTDYVATRWYRAPELIMTHYTKYSTTIDIWSAGCIFAEMLSQGEPLFPGKDGYHQLVLMTEILGSPSEEALAKVQSTRVREHFRQLPRRSRIPMTHLFPDADPLACDLLEWLLDFDPAKRPTAAQALAHPYFHGLASLGPPVTAKPIPQSEFAFEHYDLTPESMRKLFLDEILLYHPEHSREFLQNVDRGGFDMPSQAENFANSMRSVQEGIAQRKTTSMPKEQFAAICDAYRAKRQAQRKKSVEVGAGSGAVAGNGASAGVGKRGRGAGECSSASWYGGAVKRTETNIENGGVLLDNDPFANRVEDDYEAAGIVRVSSVRAGGSSSSCGASSGSMGGQTLSPKMVDEGRQPQEG